MNGRKGVSVDRRSIGEEGARKKEEEGSVRGRERDRERRRKTVEEGEGMTEERHAVK